MERSQAIQTLLMTDVVGSTRLWSAHPETMPAAIEQMEAIAQAAVEAEGGVLVKRRGEGDSLFCVFPTPVSAARSACRLVVALKVEPWPSGPRLQVRASIHCGPAYERDGDLFGPMPNRCARLREIGYGDQILLSGAARAQITGPESFGLLDLGRHRLRDLDEPEAVFQLTAADLPVDFPPLRSLTSLRNNLPIQYSSFIGRESLRRTLLERIQSDRFTTLTGAGGSGKTRLALQLGAETIDAFPDGVWFVEMADLTEETDIVHAVAEACGYQDLPSTRALDTLADRLRGRGRALLILDNAEQALVAVGKVVAGLAGRVPELRFLVTSREPLHLRGEQIHRIPPLTAPPAECTDPEVVAATEAGTLFLERARARLPEFTIDAENAGAITEIVRRLDGIPLCLEMAASHVDYLGPTQIAGRLHDRFTLLEGDDLQAPARHRTMRETIAWQYDTLSNEEGLFLQRLATFAGGFSLTAAEKVGATETLRADHVLRRLRSLVDKSLVVATPDGTEMRYRLLETIAQFAAERPECETEAAMPCLFEWALGLADTSYAGFHGPENDLWRYRVEMGLSSIHRSLDWAFASHHHQAPFVTLRMTRFWHMTGRYAQARHYLNQAVAVSTDALHPDLAGALGVFCTSLGDTAGAEAAFRQVIEDENAEPRARGRAFANLAINLHDGERLEEALEAFGKAIEALSGCGDEYGERLARYNLSLLYTDLGRYADAIDTLTQLIDEYSAAGDVFRAARSNWAIAFVALQLPDPALVRKGLGEVMRIGGPESPPDLLEDLFLCAAALAELDGNEALMAYFLGSHERIHTESGPNYSPTGARMVDRQQKKAAANERLESLRQLGRGATVPELFQRLSALIQSPEEGKAAAQLVEPAL